MFTYSSTTTIKFHTPQTFYFNNPQTNPETFQLNKYFKYLILKKCKKNTLAQIQ